MKKLGIDEMHSELFSRMNQLEVEFHTEIEKTRNRENEILSRIDRMNKTSGSVQYYRQFGLHSRLPQGGRPRGCPRTSVFGN